MGVQCIAAHETDHKEVCTFCRRLNHFIASIELEHALQCRIKSTSRGSNGLIVEFLHEQHTLRVCEHTFEPK